LILFPFNPINLGTKICAEKVDDQNNELPNKSKEQLHKAHTHILNHIGTFIPASFKLDAKCLFAIIEL
jgi:hypothetical protein